MTSILSKTTARVDNLTVNTEEKTGGIPIRMAASDSGSLSPREGLFDVKDPRILFIADFELTDKYKAKLGHLGEKIVRFNKAQFTNRDTAYLYNHGINLIWCNLANKDCREYLEWALPRSKWCVLKIYNGNKYQKWLQDDIDGAIIKKEELSNTGKQISLEKALELLSFGIKNIHAASSLFACCGSKNIKKKKAQ
jgi:hypothetical protein